MSKVILAILDGFGINTSNPKENAIEQADAPILKELFSAPYARLDASGEAVGIPAGQMGNSEVGHMTIGAGRTVLQGTMRIDASLTSGDFTKLPEFTKTLEHLRHEQIASRSRALHLFTLFGPGGVHASDKHLEKTLGLIPKEIPVFLHLFTDGRDLAPTSALEILKKFRSEILQNYENVSIASLSGRYFAMDRDNNYDRIEKAYKVITGDTEATTKSAEEVLAEVYASEKTDEFVEPVLLDQNGTVQDGDAVWFLNFRSDRARMMSEAFSQEKFAHFPTKSFKNLLFVSMVPYYQEYTGEAFFRDEALSDTLGEIISKAGLKQLRIAETEKFAHVTKFFNGGRFEPFNGETQKLIPSHKVATYDLDPAMSAEEITNTILKQWSDFPVIIVNYANGDMVGHTGSLQAAIRAVETLDQCIWQLIDYSSNNNYEILLTADHGNCEEMGSLAEPKTSHTTNFVPCWRIVDGSVRSLRKEVGTLAHLAPTVLHILGIEKPSAMEESLI